MAGLQFHFSEIDSEVAFSQLGNSLGGKAINNKIQIPAAEGNGTIRKIDFERGLHIRAWDFTLRLPFSFHRIPPPIAASSRAFSIVYILTPNAIQVDSPFLKKDSALPVSMSILLIPDDMEVNFNVTPGKLARAIDITISADWIRAQFSEADPEYGIILNKLTNNLEPALFIDTGTSLEYRTAMDLHEHTLTGDKGSLYLKAKTLSLISEFLNRSVMNMQEFTDNSNLHQEKMLAVEKMLSEHMEKVLPSIEQIAKQVALSESTLKRHFKLMFGKSLYEYYLEKKMEHAKKLLLEKPISVKEIAYRLGYEKTSNFIRIFKKFHTYSPGSLRKS